MTDAQAAAERRPRLALYHYDGCFFCAQVRRAIADLGLDVELRNIHRDPRHHGELMEARGRPTVPVLRIEEADGSVRLLAESRDIIRALHELAGRPMARGGALWRLHALRWAPLALLVASLLASGVARGVLLAGALAALVLRSVWLLRPTGAR